MKHAYLFEVLSYSSSFLGKIAFTCMQAGVPFIPHGRSMQFYTSLLENKKLPEAKRAAPPREDMDADVISAKRPPTKRRRHHEQGEVQKPRGQNPEDSDSSGGQLSHQSHQTDSMGDDEAMQELSRMMDELEPIQDELAALTPGEPASSTHPSTTAVVPAELDVAPQPGGQAIAEAPSQATPVSQALPLPPDPVQLPDQAAPSADQQAEDPNRDDLLVASGNYGVFRFTRTARGFSARCPFHRRNPRTDCKKMVSVIAPRGQPVSQASIVLCWRRLAWWCVRHSEFGRQREHVDWTPPADEAQVP